MKTAKDVLKSIKDNDVKYVDLRFTDPRGKWQHVTFDVGMIEEDTFAEGQMFDGSSIAGWKAINESDMCLMPDPVTATIDPFFAPATCWSRPPASPTTATRAAWPRRPRRWSSRWASATPCSSDRKPSSSCSTTSGSRPRPTTPASSSTPRNCRSIRTPNMRAATSATVSAPRRATSRCRRRTRCRTCAPKCSAPWPRWASRSRSITTKSLPPSTSSA